MTPDHQDLTTLRGPRTGRQDTRRQSRELPIDRFLAKCERDAISGCLIYPTTGNHYPQQWVDGRSVGIHRLALEIHLGHKLGIERLPLPPGRWVLHSPGCVGKACCEPRHLRSVGPGAASANLKDALLAGHRPVRLDHAMAAAIRRAPRTRQARRELADRFGVSSEHVRAVQAGRCWAWSS